MASLVNTLHEFILATGIDRKYCVGYSGGLDSHVLLHSLMKLRETLSIKISAVHINHGLSQNAHEWVKHCEKVCGEYQIEFVYHAVDARAALGESPEEVAREKRYQVFSQLLASNDVLLTAHHQDDQAETLLVQLFRGAGPKGLAAMPRSKVLGLGLQARPLLDFTREDLQKYAEENHLQWIQDESNTNKDFTRNFLRHEVMPVLKQRWPSIANTLSRVADHCAESQVLIEDLLVEDLVLAQGSLPNTLSVSKLLIFSERRQRQLLRLWFQQQNVSVPSAAKLEQILQTIIPAREDKTPHITWRGFEVRRYRDNLFVQRCLAEHNSEITLAWNLQEQLILPNGVLVAEPSLGAGLCADVQEVSIRFRRGGEVCRLPKRDITHDLKKLMQTWGVPPWLRDRIPLVYVGEELAAVVGYFVADEFAAKENEIGKIIHFKIPSPHKGGGN